MHRLLDFFLHTNIASHMSNNLIIFICTKICASRRFYFFYNFYITIIHRASNQMCILNYKWFYDFAVSIVHHSIFFYFACVHSEHLKQINMCIQLQCSFQYIYDKTSVSTFLCSRSISIFTFVGRPDTYSYLLYARPANPRWSCCTSGRGAGDPRCLVF